MSKLYKRAQTPTSPSNLSKRSSNHASSSKSAYDSVSKSYRNFDKYEEPELFDRSKYNKSYKTERFDKFEKTNYKSSSSDKNNDYSQYGSKNVSKVREVDLPYKSKSIVYRTDSSYSDRDNYLAKFPQDSYAKSYPSSKDGGNHPIKSSNLHIDAKRYTSPYSATKLTNVNYSSKYGNHKSFDDNFESYTGSRLSKVSGIRGRDYSGAEVQSESNNYQRYVIGNSVVYGSPGHYPKDPYPLSPKAKCRKSSLSPLNYSRFTSPPPRYRPNDKVGGRWSPYSHRTPPPRRPPSPPPLPPTYRQSSPQRIRRNYSPSADRDRRNDASRVRNGKNSENIKFDSSRDYTDRRFSAIPKPIGSPKPLLSIPLSLNNVPRESRANLRETLGIDSPPRRRFDSNKTRRFDARLGRGLTANAGSPSPKDRKRRRPDDLRLWIESRKTEGRKRKLSPRFKRDRANTGIQRTRLLETRKRLLSKVKRKSTLPIKRTLTKSRRPLPSKNHSDDARRSKERTTKKRSVRASSGPSSRTVVSNANSVPVRTKISRKSPNRARERTPQKERNYRSSDKRSRSRQRERRLSTKSERAHDNSKSRERSPKRDNKTRRD